MNGRQRKKNTGKLWMSEIMITGVHLHHFAGLRLRNFFHSVQIICS